MRELWFYVPGAVLTLFALGLYDVRLPLLVGGVGLCLFGLLVDFYKKGR